MQEILNRKRICSTPWLNLEKVDLKLPSGKVIEHNFIDAVRNSVGAVVIKENNVVLIKNFRFAVEDFSWEIPGGWINNGETALNAIQRKVEHEIGYAVDEIQRLGEGNPWLGLSNKEHYYFLVEAGKKLDQRDTQFTKEVKFFNFKKIEDMVKRGQITDQSTLTGLFLAKLHKNL